MAAPSGSKIRYDDFIANVQPDPAKPEPTVMLSGFVGRGDGEGTVRIYPDPSLGIWYDVPEAGIVHSQPIPDAPLGGSYVWVRASAQIKPGAAAAVPARAGTGGGGTDPEPTPPSIICPTQVFCPTQILCPTEIFCPAPQPPAAAGAAAPAAQAAPPQFGQTVVACSWLPCDQTQYLCCTDAKFCTFWNCTYRGAAAAMPQAAGPAAHAAAAPLTMHLSLCICDAPAFCANGTGAGGTGPAWTRGGTTCTIPSLVACTTVTTIFTTPAMPAAAGMGTGIFNPLLAAPPMPAAVAAAAAPAQAGLPHHTLPLCTQGAPTVCGCTPGIACMAPAAQAVPQQAAFQPTPSAVTLCCLQAQAGFGHPTPQTHCFVCDPAAPVHQAAPAFATPVGCTAASCPCLMAQPPAAAAMAPTPTAMTHCVHCLPQTGAACPPPTALCQAGAAPQAAAFSPLTICFGGAGCPPQSHICTQIGCAPPGGHTAATVCTQLGCTHGFVCPPGRTGIFTPFGG
ncbi:MAG TPA: hypothetical protein VF601_10135 [Beijerinckiaceae bacterium]|jgi:hypothetical protein